MEGGKIVPAKLIDGAVIQQDGTIIYPWIQEGEPRIQEGECC